MALTPVCHIAFIFSSHAIRHALPFWFGNRKHWKMDSDILASTSNPFANYLSSKAALKVHNISLKFTKVGS